MAKFIWNGALFDLRWHLLADHHHQDAHGQQLQINRTYHSPKPVKRAESMPKLSFSRRSLLVEAGVKNPVTATKVITDLYKGSQRMRKGSSFSDKLTLAKPNSP